MEPSRVHRALHNFSVRKDYEHEIVFSQEKRLCYNEAYSWAIEKFGEPGDSWDFYIVKHYEPTTRYNMHKQQEMWVDIFGFMNDQHATLFMLRWC